MATPVIASSASAVLSHGSATTVTITKPTGLATGDLMLVVLSAHKAGGITINDESGWTTLGTNSVDDVRHKAMYKVADAGDVAASNFTFDVNSTTVTFGGILFRITGQSTTSPIADSHFGVESATTASPSFSCSILAGTADALLIMSLGAASLATGGATTSGYSISGSNPTWTEQFDDRDGTAALLAVASATANSIAEITSFTATFSETSAETGGILIAISATTNGTASPAVISSVASVQTPTVVVTGNITATVISCTATIPAPVVAVGVPKWENADKASTSTWTSTDKS